jgi:hypothetical protein
MVRSTMPFKETIQIPLFFAEARDSIKVRFFWFGRFRFAVNAPTKAKGDSDYLVYFDDHFSLMAALPEIP